MMRFLTLGVLVAGLAAALMPSREAAAQDPMTIEQLRGIVDTLFSGDTAAIEDLLQFTSVPCTENPKGPGALPQCRKGETQGTLIEGFPNATCEGGYSRPDEVQPIIDDLANPEAEVLAIYRYETALTPEAFFYGDYVVLVSTPPTFPQYAGGVFIGDGLITGFAYGCGQTADQFAEFWGLTEQVSLDEATATATATAQLTATPVATALPSTGTGNPGDGAGGELSICVALIALGSLAVVAVGITLFRQAKA